MTQQRARASFAIPWQQTEIDGVAGAPPSELRLGATWRWRGEAVRLTGRAPTLRLLPPDHEDRRTRAARMVARLSGIDAQADDIDPDPYDDDLLSDGTVAVTDGTARHVLALVRLRRSGRLLVMVDGSLPPRDTDLWVSRAMRSRAGRAAALQPPSDPTGLAEGTRIATPRGPVAVEHLREGDLVLTRDGHVAPVWWIGARRLSGAQLYLRPDHRPIRVAPDAFGAARPHAPLLVAPGQGVVRRSRSTRSLFNAAEVLVAAKDMTERHMTARDLALTEVTYYNLLLPKHALLVAEGAAVESFHPAASALSSLAPEDRARLVADWPRIAENPEAYGPFACRRLDPGEAAILGAAAA